MKKNVIFALIILALVLLLINIFITSNVKESAVPARTENYRSEIDSIFISALNEYQLDKSWIKKIPIENKKNDSIKYVYQISIPKDISIAELAGNVNSHFAATESVFISEELANYGKTEIRIYSGGILKLQAFIKPNKRITRLHSKMALLVDCSAIAGETEFEKYAGFSYDFSVLLSPSFQSFLIKEKLVAAGKEYAILISDNIEDKKYRLRSGSAKPILETNVNNLVSDFGDAGLFVIDKESDIYNSASYSFVKEQFSRKGKTLKRKDRFKMLTAEDPEEVVSLFNFFAAQKDSSLTYQILLSSENFNLLQPNISASIKKGVKFIAL
ncbi:MAG: hypothetical protein GXO87_12500 [Chlorobi bacterium]|nr:hypothetical protein [Chlorobiota bacterium]